MRGAGATLTKLTIVGDFYFNWAIGFSFLFIKKENQQDIVFQFHYIDHM